MIESPVWRVSEAAAYLGAKKSFIYKLIHAGTIRYQKVGDHFVTPREDVERYLAGQWVKNGR
jgi:excisionase family DNA binding protein